MKPQKLFSVFIALAVLTLAGCGGGGSTPTPTSATLTGSVVKGPVVGAAVIFFALNADGSKGAQLGTAITASTGTYTVTLTPAPTTPVLAVATGGTYVDEATGATTTLLAGDTLRAVLPAATTIATVTPLTEIAAARALALAAGGTPLATAVNSSNIAVAQQYNVDNIVTTLPVPANDAARVAIATLAEKQYGLVLAGIAQNAKTLGVRPIDLAAALATDAKDGLLNGTNGGAPINVPLIAGGTFALPVIAGTTNIQTAINAFIASANNKSGLTQMPITLTPVQLGVNTASGLYTTLAVLPAAISGKAYAAGVTATGGTPPYTCALKAGSTLPAGYSLVPNTCQITGTGALLGGGTTKTISAPFTITLTDSAISKVSVDLTLYLTTVLPAPVGGGGDAKPIIAIHPSTITFLMQPKGNFFPSLLYPPSCSQSFTISNIGPAGSKLDYYITASDVPYVIFTNGSGSLASGQSVIIDVHLDTTSPIYTSGYFGQNMFLRIFTPGTTLPIALQEIWFKPITEALLGTWGGTWSGNSYANLYAPNASSPVNGTWTLNLQTVDVANSTASGTLTWNGIDKYWVYTYDEIGVFISATPKPFIPNRTILFNSSNTRMVFPSPGTGCGRVLLSIDGFYNTINPSDAFYGPSFQADFFANSLIAQSFGTGFRTHPYNPSNFETAGSGGTVTGSKQ